MIGPELGATKPGMTIVCGDSHTSTHGAFGALAFGIGTSEVEHVMATQTLPQSKPRTFLIQVNGDLPFGVTAKDIILDMHRPHRRHRRKPPACVIWYAGSLPSAALSMEARMGHLQHRASKPGPAPARSPRQGNHLRLPRRPPLYSPPRSQHGI